MEKKFMNKLDDMELDMVAGGGFWDTLKDATTSVVKSAAKPMKKLIEADIDAMGKNPVVKGVKAVGNAFDRMLYKVFGPPRKR